MVSWKSLQGLPSWLNSRSPVMKAPGTKIESWNKTSNLSMWWSFSHFLSLHKFLQPINYQSGQSSNLNCSSSLVTGSNQVYFQLIVHSLKVLSVALHVSVASLFTLSFSSFFASLVDHYNLSLVHKLSQTQVLLIPSLFNKLQSIKPGFATEGLSCLTYICQSQGLKKLSKRLVYDTCI